jgi:hypothetical protein
MRRLVLIFVAGAGLAATGCGVLSSPEDRATDDARAKATRVGNVLYSSRVRTGQDLGHRASELRDVEVMRVTGASTDAREGVRLVIRVPGVASSGWLEPQQITVRRCFQLTFDGDDEWDARPPQVDCPRGLPLTYGPWPKEPEIGEGVYEQLRKRLPRVPPAGAVSEAEVRKVVGALRLDPKISQSFATQSGVVGVALTTPPGRSGDRDCLLARVAPGDTSVWSPSRVQRMAGEGGCSAGNAINPMRPPH